MNWSETTIPLGILQNPARFLFFTGKGGVGKTALACAGCSNCQTLMPGGAIYFALPSYLPAQ